MSDSRSAILGRIRAAKGRQGPLDEAKQAELRARLKGRPRGIIPTRAQGDTSELVAAFSDRARAVESSVATLASLDDLPDAIADYLAQHNLPATLRVAPHDDLTPVDWAKRPTLSVSAGPSDGKDAVSVTRAFAGIAETGTLMLEAGPQAPTTLHFLPETHIVVLKRSEIVGAYEDAWDRLRDKIGPDGMLSRVVNMITGPSRTGDIEQTIELGAHGPLRLHILILENG